MSDAAGRDAIDGFEIGRLLARLAHAVDDRDVERYRACFTDRLSTTAERSENGAAPPPVAAADHARDAVRRAAALDWTHHNLSNVDIVVTRGTAEAIADVVIMMQWTPPGEAPERLTIGGRYSLGLVRCQDGWRIARRHRSTRFAIGDPSLPERALAASNAG